MIRDLLLQNCYKTATKRSLLQKFRSNTLAHIANNRNNTFKKDPDCLVWPVTGPLQGVACSTQILPFWIALLGGIWVFFLRAWGCIYFKYVSAHISQAYPPLRGCGWVYVRGCACDVRVMRVRRGQVARWWHVMVVCVKIRIRTERKCYRMTQESHKIGTRSAQFSARPERTVPIVQGIAYPRHGHSLPIASNPIARI